MVDGFLSTVLHCSSTLPPPRCHAQLMLKMSLSLRSSHCMVAGINMADLDDCPTVPVFPRYRIFFPLMVFFSAVFPGGWVNPRPFLLLSLTLPAYAIPLFPVRSRSSPRFFFLFPFRSGPILFSSRYNEALMEGIKRSPLFGFSSLATFRKRYPHFFFPCDHKIF